ncbi:MAG TPA: TonB-dependent receptor, partial [Gemmatimonadales bacterium]|nr:TonB-dependent receptor [Gemmatimonadales bacterium]
ALALVLSFAGRGAGAQTPDSIPSPSALKRLSLEQLMAIEVTSVSRRPEPLSSTASAIQIITGNAIRRSGASNLPEALRLLSNLQVAQVNSSQWAVSARGFNNVLANKLLVLIDGRTVYTPLYAGVFWDVQNVPLEAVDRIEVVSGPGGALWGANAVNGVINVVSRSAGETQGLALEGGGGTELHAFGGLRYGGTLGSGLAYRVYGMGFGRGATSTREGTDAGDAWGLGQGGFRMDWTGGERDRFTLQGDYYEGRPDPDGDAEIVARGANAVGRWTRTLSQDSDLQLQLYYDRTHRDFGNGFTEDLSTYDLDGQHRVRLDSRQELIWGLGYRLMDHQTENVPLLRFEPAHKLLHLFSGFVQDEIALVDGRLRATLGTKLEHTTYTGVEIQPSARLAWTPAASHTVWSALSRAVRTPSRIDRDFSLLAAPGVPIIEAAGFESEDVLAVELGWRHQPAASLSLSLATFYNEYDDLRSAEPGPPPLGLPITLANGVEGNAYGIELSSIYQPSDRWRLRAGYTFLRKDLSTSPGSNDLNRATAESNDPEHRVLLHSSADLPGGIWFDAVLRAVDELPDPRVPGYVDLDLRLAWHPTRQLELSLTGQNLLHGDHVEFIPSSPSPRRIERGVYGKITWR